MVVAEHPVEAGLGGIFQVLGCFGIAERVQVGDETLGSEEGVEVVVAEYPAGPSQRIFV